MNRQGRQTTDPKVYTLKFRINDEMRIYIENVSKKRGITASEYLRLLVKKDMDSKSFCISGGD